MRRLSDSALIFMALESHTSVRCRCVSGAGDGLGEGRWVGGVAVGDLVFFFAVFFFYGPRITNVGGVSWESFMWESRGEL